MFQKKFKIFKKGSRPYQNGKLFLLITTSNGAPAHWMAAINKEGGRGLACKGGPHLCWPHVNSISRVLLHRIMEGVILYLYLYLFTFIIIHVQKAHFPLAHPPTINDRRLTAGAIIILPSRKQFSRVEEIPHLPSHFGVADFFNSKCSIHFFLY